MIFPILHENGISLRLIKKVLFLVALLGLIFSVIHGATDYYRDMSNHDNTLALIKKTHADAISSALWGFDNQQTEALLEGIHHYPYVSYVAILKGEATVMEKGEKQKKHFREMRVPLKRLFNGRELLLGTLYLQIDTASIIKSVTTTVFVSLLFQSLAIAVVAFFIILIYDRQVLQPLHSLSKSFAVFSEDNLAVPLKIPRKEYGDEIDDLVASFNVLRESLSVANRNRQESQYQLLQSQKMNAIGSLAGGVAHDFNNILTVVSGYASLLKMSQAYESDESVMTDEILKSVSRAEEMTRSLLTFSRQKAVSLQQEDLNRVVSGLEKSLSRLIREDIDLEVCLTDMPLFCRMDKGQMEQVIINLTVNARDAISSRGKISITSDMVSHVENQTISAPAGSYALLSISDTGAGMDKETLNRIYEPFFTTKEQGKGTGLGLSIVYGIIRNHKGFIDVSSTPGNGTSFRIYLPVDDLVVAREEENKRTEMPHGCETILLVEDDTAVRQMAAQLIEIKGYRVITAQNGEEGLKIFKDNIDKIQLIVSDVIMPRKNGREMYEEISSIKSGVPIVLMSGYSDDILDGVQAECGDIYFLPKPLKAADLLTSIRRALDMKSS